MLLLPGNPGLLLFHIAVVFAEGDEREVEGGVSCVCALYVSLQVTRHRPPVQVRRALLTANVDNHSSGAADSKFYLFSSFELGAMG